ncbi:serine aminopeptidase domain-containing protein [Mycobacterium sp. 1465703.0]|uniref:serine aminopeptidase domain-containing protein n=1 Tax=Mycobacterium sp. 1465703.0 TaxID=1834078 RepID=UPI0008002654|nr:alpha/beta hydrolase [Mycobacterium sp. 1465703.0]OBI95488.1 hypothetical protein A5625_08250 [Mycobacterium sp. 1465703.0]
MTTYSIDDVEFPSSGELCPGWRLVSQNDRLRSSAGRPIVVMAHGVGGTIDTGLQPFAEKFCATGADVLAVDYRGFGASSGAARQSVSMRRQRSRTCTPRWKWPAHSQEWSRIGSSFGASPWGAGMSSLSLRNVVISRRSLR